MRFSTTMTSAVALAVALGSPVLAQEAVPPAEPAATETSATAPDDGASADIIVTAQKRSERLQDVPVAVSVISGDALASQGRLNLEGAQALVPALNFQKSGTTLNQALFLRGVGTSFFSIAGEPSVSTVVDGVVFARAGEAFGDLVDVERIEVLRGPQGTLFGKNASAGVINIVSQRPADTLSGYAEVGYFSEDEYRARAALNIPFSENIRSRFSGFYTDYEGNIFNRAPDVNRRVNGFKHYGGRAQIEADPSEAVRLTFIADYHKNKDDCCAELIGTPPTNAAGAFVTNASTAVLPTPRGDETRVISQNLVTRTNETGYGFSLQADAEVGGQTVTSITAYRNYKNIEIRDGDFLPAAYIGLNQLHDRGPQTGNTFSQELRLTSPGRQFIDYVIGAYYSRAESRRVFTRDAIACAPLTTPAPTTLTPCSSPLARPSTFPTGTADFGSVFKNFALFGQGTVNVADNFRLIGGLRYSVDQLNVFLTRVAANLATNAGGQPVATGGINPNFGPFNGKTTNTNLSGKAGAQFDISPRSTLYGTYSRGYKGPAFNVFFNLGATGTNVIDPETSDAYEIGLKNTLFGGTLVVNLAGFYAKYENFQANSPDLAGGVVVTRFTNAGSVSTRGGELDLVWRPVRDLSVTGGVAYTDAKVDQFKVPPGAPPTAIIPSGTPLAYAPKWKGTLGADYRVRTGGILDFFAGAQGSYQSKQLSLFSTDAVQRQFSMIGGYGLVNLSAGLQDPDDKYKVTFQVRNLFDQSFAAFIQNGGPGGAYRYQIPRDADRYYGVTGRVNF